MGDGPISDRTDDGALFSPCDEFLSKTERLFEMMHSAPRAAASAVPVPYPSAKSPALYLPKGARPTPRPPRPSFMTRRYEARWLTAEGHVEGTTRTAPALPEFEEAFSAIARGTLIETTQGFVAVEDLEPGMVAVTGEGRREVITWIGSMTLFPAGTIPGLASSAMTRITADAFGGGRPMPDLLLGPQARLLMKDARTRAAGHPAAYLPARALVDGESIIEVAPVAPVTMYHLVLERQGSLACAGIEIESYHPGRNLAERLEPQLAAMLLALFPQMTTFADFGPMSHPRLALDEAEGLQAA